MVVRGKGLISFVYAEGEHAGKEKTAKRILRNGTFGRNIFRNEAEVVYFVLNDADTRLKYVEYLRNCSSTD